jgi:hypothetical protein
MISRYCSHASNTDAKLEYNVQATKRSKWVYYLTLSSYVDERWVDHMSSHQVDRNRLRLKAGTTYVQN